MGYAASTIATFDNMLGTLAHLAGRARDTGVPLDARLAPDMAPLATQVRFVTYQVLNTLNRLGGAGAALPEADPAGFDEASAMIAAAREALGAHPAEGWVAADSPVEFDLPNGMVFALTAHEYVRDWSVPQFYFHVMAFYAILRAQGVGVGKADYVPFMMKHLKQPAAA
jgi:hypothetical protein